MHQIMPGLTADETFALRDQGKVPGDYAALMTPAVGMQLQIGVNPDTQKKVVQITAVFAVDYEALPLPTGGIVDAQGQSSMQRKFQEILGGYPPVLRILVERSALSEADQKRLEGDNVVTSILSRLKTVPDFEGPGSEEGGAA